MKNKTGFIFIVSIVLICPPLFAEQAENKPLPAVNQQQGSAPPPAVPAEPAANDTPSAVETTPPPAQKEEVKEPVKESKQEKANKPEKAPKEPKKKKAEKKSEAPASSTQASSTQASSTQDGSVIPATEPSKETTTIESQAIVEVKGIYRSGSAPLKSKSKVKLNWNGSEFIVTNMNNSSASAWKLSIAKLRGAKKVDDGFWIYWYDAAGSTLSAFFDTGKEPTDLAEMINKSLADYYSLEKRIKTNFEAYKEQALKEAQ